MLRVDEDRLARGDAEEVGIELVDMLQEPTAPGDVQTRKSLAIPSRGRNRADTIDSVTEQSPECRGPVRAREPAPDADDRDRLATLAPDWLNLSPIDFGATTRRRGTWPERRWSDSHRRASERAFGQATARARPRAARPEASRGHSLRAASLCRPRRAGCRAGRRSSRSARPRLRQRRVDRSAWPHWIVHWDRSIPLLGTVPPLPVGSTRRRPRANRPGNSHGSGGAGLSRSMSWGD